MAGRGDGTRVRLAAEPACPLQPLDGGIERALGHRLDVSGECGDAFAQLITVE
jgi:hypothetical protein